MAKKLTAKQKRQRKLEAQQPKSKSRAQLKREQRLAAQKARRKAVVTRNKAVKERTENKVKAIRDELHRKISRANARLLRLERAGITVPSYTITLNTLGRDRFTLRRGASKEERERIEIMVNRFLADETTTIRGAEREIKRQREEFTQNLRTAFVGEIAPDVIEKMYYGWGDIDVKALAREYLYEEINAMFHDIEDIGLTPTDSNLARGIDDGLEMVVRDELRARGVKGNLDLLVDIAINNGFDFALRQYEYERKGNK